MAQPNSSDAGDGKAAQPQSDSAMVGQKLLDDLQHKYLPGNNTDSVNQLVKDGILPAGSTVIDFGAVQKHLDGDQKKLADLRTKQPADTTAAAEELADARAVQGTAQTAFDAAKSNSDQIEAKIAERNKQDEQVKKDFDTVSGALKKDTVEKDDLTKVVADTSQPQAVRDAAQHLLGTFHEETYQVAARKGASAHTAQRETDDYAGNHTFSDKPYFDKDSIADGAAKHANDNAADKKTLEPLVAIRDKALDTLKAADQDVQTKLTAFSDLTTQNQALADNQTKLAAQIKEEQTAITPDESLDKLGRVVRGGGYYQVAENLLGIDDQDGPSNALQAKELMLLTHLLQAEAKALNNGNLPQHLRENDQILKPENLQRVMDKLKTAIAPPTDTPPADTSKNPPPDAQK